MAFILSLMLYILIHSFGNQREMAEISRRIGGIFVILTGAVLMLTTVFKDKIKILSNRHNQEKFQNLSLYAIAVLSGIVPCPLAWTVLVFAISYNMYLYGIISVLAMAIGAAITVGTTGLLILMGREAALSHVKKKYAEKFASNLRFAGGFILFILGIKMSMP
jgi:ABC-type nickel/cobalt efflux system permease component RcnA